MMVSWVSMRCMEACRVLSRVRRLSLLVMTAGEQQEEEDGGDSKQEAGGDACASGLHPTFYRFCTITLVTLITFVTLAFSIHLLLRYLKIRSPT